MTETKRGGTMREALERLASMEAFDHARAINPLHDGELIARVEYARASLPREGTDDDVVAQVLAIVEDGIPGNQTSEAYAREIVRIVSAALSSTGDERRECARIVERVMTEWGKRDSLSDMLDEITAEILHADGGEKP